MAVNQQHHLAEGLAATAFVELTAINSRSKGKRQLQRIAYVWIGKGIGLRIYGYILTIVSRDKITLFS